MQTRFSALSISDSPKGLGAPLDPHPYKQELPGKLGLAVDHLLPFTVLTFSLCWQSTALKAHINLYGF